MPLNRYALSIHLFRRDLRLFDNTALQAALRASAKVVPIFIFDDRQTIRHPYFSDPAFHFMLQSLRELEDAIQKTGGMLQIFFGCAEEVIQRLLKQYPIQAVYCNRDYTPFSRMRDGAIAAVCKSHGIDFYQCADALLHEPEEVLKNDGTPYLIFTPFHRKARTLKVSKPLSRHVDKQHFYEGLMQDACCNWMQQMSSLVKEAGNRLPGGRSYGLRALLKLKDFQNYAEDRNFPARDATSHLSAHHKFGTISIRETYHAVLEAFNSAHVFLSELYWRDFFTHIGFHFPSVLKGAFHSRYDALPWRKNDEFFERWKRGETGFPIVDAGMRELNATGYMHNRVRMITASFLVKDLLIDWRDGERYFATRLIDYDPLVNNGNWQWAASTGCDAVPYFRIFNPWLQQKKFDPDAAYIMQWVPELAHIDATILHDPAKLQDVIKDAVYKKPCVVHSEQAEIVKAMFRAHQAENCLPCKNL